MASIVLKNLKNKQKAETGYTYSDLHLDISEVVLRTTPSGDVIKGRDIRLDYDIGAIINSLVNIFNTNKGERFLVPDFGSNLKRYIFESITEHTGRKIGDEIVYAIETWEPRVSINQVSVVAIPDQNQYDVTIRLIINALKKQVSLSGIVDINNEEVLQRLKQV